MTQLNQNTTDLQSILDAVNALPEASNTEIGVSYNADGTQNLIIKDDGSVIEIPDPNPVLLWTNASPTSAFAPQTVTVAGDAYDAYLIEVKGWDSAEVGDHSWGVTMVDKDGVVHSVSCIGRYTYTGAVAVRKVTATGNSIAFETGFSCAASAGSTVASDNSSAIPTRIWGVKFTL